MMISLDVAAEQPTSSQRIITPKDGEQPATSSFSELLSGVVTKSKNDGSLDTTQTLLLSFNNETLDPIPQTDTFLSTTKETLTSLLEDETLVMDESSDTVLNSKLLDTLSDQEIQSLIKDAKNFLSQQIKESSGYKQAQTKELPNSLQGLVKMAKTYDIDLSKITLESVQNSDVATAKVLNTPQSKIKSTNQNLQTMSDSKEPQEIEIQEKTKTSLESKSLKEAPLFKAQTSTEHTTEQIVQTKVLKVEEKTPQQKADETLKLLLQGEKALKSDKSGLTADFSVATAKVIAPSATKQESQDLESLLKGDTKEEQQTTLYKSDNVHSNKADSFEVKLHEAKQMTKYLSQDVKSAIDNYKSPFTRVKVQLNPQRLGEIDVTIVQRGKDLHINLSSNNAAINTLSMNANDLKVQLQNNGIQNASLNFNNNSQGENAQSGQQQHQQREANKEYSYFSEQEENEEILSSLEIVVPNYA